MMEPLRRLMAQPGPRSEMTARAEALRNAHVFFERHSGWAPPDPDTLAEWLADGVCRCPDECLVLPEASCEHGIASWKVILDDLDDHDRRVGFRRDDAGGSET